MKVELIRFHLLLSSEFLVPLHLSFAEGAESSPGEISLSIRFKTHYSVGWEG